MTIRKTISAFAAIALAALSLSACKPDGNGTSSGSSQTRMERTEAVKRLDDLLRNVRVSERQAPTGTASALPEMAPGAHLPPIASFPLSVAAKPDSASVEILASVSTAGAGTDGWLREAAESFNAAGLVTKNGKPMQVSLRKIASGTAYEFVLAGTSGADGITTSSDQWFRMAEAQGVKLTTVKARTVQNRAGLVMKQAAFDKLKKKGEVDVRAAIDAAVRGEISIGYTDPYSSSTGLNFLSYVLQTFAGGDEARMLSPDVASAFEAFQKSVPFVAMTTMQMRDSVLRDGSLDAFVLESQPFNSSELRNGGYVFLPFGQTHDNPLAAIGVPKGERKETLERFAAFLDSKENKARAIEMGFSEPTKDETVRVAGKTLLQAQKLWKSKKDAGRPVAAVFIADTSGSMRGSRIAALKIALASGSRNIGARNRIGLIEFNDAVTVLQPIRPFSLITRQSFLGSVEALSADGGTAMYDAIAVAEKMLIDEKIKDPDVRPVIIVLTDGDTNRGMEAGTLRPVIVGLSVPIYTIGFEAKVKGLAELSSLVEAASMNAGEDDVAYKIGALLNAQM
jgi:Ca-activated chloride channel family protein